MQAPEEKKLSHGSALQSKGLTVMCYKNSTEVKEILYLESTREEKYKNSR